MARWELKRPVPRVPIKKTVYLTWSIGTASVPYEVRHSGYWQYNSRGGKMLKLLQTEAQLSAILWLDREKLIVTAEESF